MVKNERGQFIVEAIIIMMILLGFSTIIVRGFRDNDIIVNLVSGPWQGIDGMVQNGSWGPPDKTSKKHPNNHEVHASVRGE